MFAAKYMCEKNGLDFGHVFSRQYCMSKASLPHVENWKRSEKLLGWGITHCPKLECRTITDTFGKPLGWFLGTAVDQSGALIGNKLELPTEVGANDFWEIVEEEITFLAGRYIAFLITEKGKRAYFDPVMDLPLVFNAREEMVGTSPLMALTRELRTNDRIDHKLIMKDGGNYGMQQTCDPDVLRGLSNHYLDLESFALHRHWPSSDEAFESGAVDLNETAKQIVARLAQVTGALIKNYSCAMPLSGGNDSRTLVFSAKENINLAQLFSHKTNMITGLDCYVAKLLADELGQDLQIIDAVGHLKTGSVQRKDIRKLRRDFCRRTGYQKALSNAELVAADRIPDADLVLRGNILDMARANQWPRNAKFSIGHAISKLAIGGRPPAENLSYWGAEYQSWLGTLPTLARARTYDFAFIEQLLPNTLGGRLIGCSKATYVNPFNDRNLIKACMMVDPKRRRSGELNKALHAAGGVSAVPFTSKIKRSTELKKKARELFE